MCEIQALLRTYKDQGEPCNIDRERQTDRQRQEQTYIERDNTDELSIAGIFFAVRYGPLQRKEVGVVDLDVILSIPSDCLLFSETNAAVLKWSEYGRWDVVIVTLHTPMTHLNT